MAPKVVLALLLSVILGVAPATRGAEEQTSEHTVIGLFSPDREQDLRDVLADVPEFQLVKIDYENARAAFRYDLAALFPNLNAKKPPTPAEVEQRLNTLLKNASTDSFSLKLSATVPKEKLTKIEINMGICDCKGCRYAVYLVVTKVAGVEQATVSKDSVITAWIDPTKTDRAAIENALKKLERK